MVAEPSSRSAPAATWPPSPFWPRSRPGPARNHDSTSFGSFLDLYRPRCNLRHLGMSARWCCAGESAGTRSVAHRRTVHKTTPSLGPGFHLRLWAAHERRLSGPLMMLQSQPRRSVPHAPPRWPHQRHPAGHRAHTPSGTLATPLATGHTQPGLTHIPVQVGRDRWQRGQAGRRHPDRTVALEARNRPPFFQDRPRIGPPARGTGVAGA